jgi:hypothetical protein
MLRKDMNDSSLPCNCCDSLGYLSGVKEMGVAVGVALAKKCR